jgi:competence protein ComEC
VTVRGSPHIGLAALCAGLAAANVVRPPVVAGACVAGALLALASVTRQVTLLVAALAAVGLVWAGARLDALDRSPLSTEIGHAGHVELVVTSPARRSPFDMRFTAEARTFHGLAVREPVLVRLPPGRAPPQGAIVDVLAEIVAPHGPRNGFDERAYLRRHGIHVVLRAQHPRVVGARGGLLGAVDRLRSHIARTMAPGLTGERRALVAGVVLGEDEGLSRKTADAFRTSGLYHLIAVSGQNVLIVGGGVLLLALLFGVSRLVAEAAAIVTVLGYLAAVGWQPSVVRAGIAGILGSLAWLAARPRDRWYFVLAGAAVLLAWNPYSLLDPGFQLSFAAVAAIFVAVPLVRGRLDGYPLPGPVAEALAVSLVCGVATAPLLLWQFGYVPVYSVPANVLVAPAVAPLLGCGLVAAAVEPVAPWLSLQLAQIEGVLAAYVIAVARAFSALPYARMGQTELAMVGCTVVLAAVALRRLRDARRPGPVTAPD